MDREELTAPGKAIASVTVRSYRFAVLSCVSRDRP